MTRPIAVSLVAFDGVPLAAALEDIARAGATHAEPAYISGTMVFGEEDLADPGALRRALADAGLGCVAISAHMDNGAEDAPEKLLRRLRFAGGLGARFVITNTARADRLEPFMRHVAEVIPETERAGVRLAFENPGHGADDLLARGGQAAALLARIGSPWVVLNYDVGNVLTNSEGAVRPEDDLALALPRARHLHLKDMARQGESWSYRAIGEGELDYDSIFRQVATRPELPVCVELPLRQMRARYAAPVRAAAAPAREEVRGMVARSVRRVREGLGE